MRRLVTASLTVFADPVAVAEAAVARIVERCEAAQGGHLVLGGPAGRTPLLTYRAFARVAARRCLDLGNLHLVLMDEYLENGPDGWRLCPADAHYSCRRFIDREVREPVNRRLPPRRRLRVENVHLPDPRDPEGYERLIESLGGVDLFLLASGTSDGHVAFNPAGTPLTARTRVVALAEATRRDNLATFPDFRDIAEVPTHGVSVGPATIVRWSRAALLVITGEHKAEAFRQITERRAYDPAWPASVVHACVDGMIFADRAAAGLAEPAEEQVPCGR